MDSGFNDERSAMEADKYFEAMRRGAKEAEIERLRQENLRLLELVSNLQKDGFTYEQLNRTMIVCDACGKNIGKNND